MNQIYGIRPVIEAINSGLVIEKIYFRKGLKGSLFGELYALVREREISYQFVPSEWFNRYKNKNNQGVVAVISLVEYVDFEEMVIRLTETKTNPLFLILDGITDVGNFGSIARTAECAGVDLIVIRNKNSAQINEVAVKTSAGAILKIPVSRVKSLVKSIEYLRNSGFQTVAATEKGNLYHYQTDFRRPTALIMGAEDKGIKRELLALSDIKAKIPILGETESLNVAAATAVILYEVVRQKLNF